MLQLQSLQANGLCINCSGGVSGRHCNTSKHTPRIFGKLGEDASVYAMNNGASKLLADKDASLMQGVTPSRFLAAMDNKQREEELYLLENEVTISLS